VTTIWCQWSDLQLPSGFELISKPISELTSEQLERVEFYVPLYMGGINALRPIDSMPNLKVVQLLMAGFDDALPFMRPGICLFNARGVHDFSTAELTLGLILSSLRGIKQFALDQQNAKWNHQRFDSLFGKRIAIVGAGSIGQKINSFLQPFEVSVEFFGRSKRAGVSNLQDLDASLSEFDVVILIVPLTNETRGLFNAERISRMKSGALLVNVARGAVVNTADLLEALHSGHIKAALDVTDPEPLPAEHPLWRAPNLLISPHVGGNSSAFEPHARKLISEQCTRFASGAPLINEIEW